MNNTTQTASVSFPLFGVLGVVFVVLKLTGVIAWSWWWVLLPFYGPYLLGLVILGVFLLIALIATAVRR